MMSFILYLFTFNFISRLCVLSTWISLSSVWFSGGNYNALILLQGRRRIAQSV